MFIQQVLEELKNLEGFQKINTNVVVQASEKGSSLNLEADLNKTINNILNRP